MAKLWKRALRCIGCFILIFSVISVLAIAGLDKPGKGKGKGLGRGRGGAPELGIMLLVGTGLATVGALKVIKTKKRNKDQS